MSETVSPTTASGTNWTNPNNVVSSNDVYATYVNTGGTNVSPLTVEGFDFTKTGLVLGLKVEVEGKVSSGTKSFFCYLVKGAQFSETKGFSLGTTEGYATLGSETDLWDAAGTLNFEDGDLDDLQVIIYANSATQKTTSIDHVRCVIYYTLGATLEGAQPAPSGSVVAKWFAAIAGAQPAPAGTVVGVFANKKLAGLQPAASGTIADKTANKQLSGAQPAATGSIFAGLTEDLAGAQPGASGAVVGVFENKLIAGNQAAAVGVLIYLQVAVHLAGAQPAASGAILGAFIRNPVKLSGGRGVLVAPRLGPGRARAMRPGG
ncbi:MAG: hypothetical protein AB7I04_18425 [Pseudomonadales bacterium]